MGCRNGIGKKLETNAPLGHNEERRGHPRKRDGREREVQEVDHGNVAEGGEDDCRATVLQERIFLRVFESLDLVARTLLCTGLCFRSYIFNASLWFGHHFFDA